jgi:hypothetical protein
MADKDKNEQESEKLIPVGDGVEDESTEVKDTNGKEKDDDKEEESSEAEASDERVGKGEDDDKDDEGEGKTTEEREAIRARRRVERHNRRQREARERKELTFLRKRNEDVEKQLSQLAMRQDKTEEASIDQRIGYIDSQIKVAEGLHAKAVEKGDGATATEALSVKDGLREHLAKLNQAKEGLKARAEAAAKEKTTEQEEPAGEIDPVVRENVQSWFNKHKAWFDPKLSNPDSRLAKSIEDHLFAEGEHDPSEPEYWDELDRRIARVLPNRVKAKEKSTDTDDDQDEKPTPKRKGGGPRFTTGGRERSLKPNEVYIDRQRREALQEAGLWDDPEARERYLRAYKSYDDEARQQK